MYTLFLCSVVSQARERAAAGFIALLGRGKRTLLPHKFSAQVHQSVIHTIKVQFYNYHHTALRNHQVTLTSCLCDCATLNRNVTSTVTLDVFYLVHCDAVSLCRQGCHRLVRVLCVDARVLAGASVSQCYVVPPHDPAATKHHQL